MIIFYDGTNGEIVGTIDGRVHSPLHLKVEMKRGGKLAERYVVPTEPVVKEQIEPVEELRVVDRNTMKVEPVKVGEMKVQRVSEYRLGGEFADFFQRVENREIRLSDYKAKIDKSGKLVGFEKKN